ncbi:hypothetical protein HW130_25555 [Streptomyces sp. PKU-EA00015]|uniref:hypothetical protein n=1 Tax=Streptomyces sp. PKU-EA00015 TaxID=2748326 RepID=UPI0015A02A60|nr:hypothetical protein [Streptomyces sp. PKU-EA00015]NWF29579.1 hypothetical protein [Streptomyces sp. PKU-EA00015]
MIDEAVVQELLDATEDDAALVLLEGTAQVVNRTALDSDAFHGAAVLLSRAELVDLLGTSSPAQEDVARVTASLRDTVGKLGA